MKKSLEHFRVKSVFAMWVQITEANRVDRTKIMTV